MCVARTMAFFGRTEPNRRCRYGMESIALPIHTAAHSSPKTRAADAQKRGLIYHYRVSNPINLYRRLTIVFMKRFAC